MVKFAFNYLAFILTMASPVAFTLLFPGVACVAAEESGIAIEGSKLPNVVVILVDDLGKTMSVATTWIRRFRRRTWIGSPNKG